MPLHKIREFDPNYRQYFNDQDILNFDVYSGNEKVGPVDDLLVDEAGQFRYFVINAGVWFFGKKVLLPIGLSRIDGTARRIYVDGLIREQVKNLPEYTGEPVDYDYEERVRGIYRPSVASRGAVAAADVYDRHSYRYDRDPALYALTDRGHHPLKQAEERLRANRSHAGRHRRSVGVFPNHQTAEQALHELRDSGFPMDRVSVVTRDADKPDEIAGADVRDRIGNKADEGATIGAVSGGALGGLTGLLVGLGTLAIPGIGPIMLAGATATALATTLAGGAIGAVSGGLLGALIGLGIPEERARVYHDRIARGDYLVIVDGTDAEIARAETILQHRGIEEYGVYDAPGTVAAAMPVASTHPTGTVPFGRRSAVGFFPDLTSAEHAITDLRSIGFPLNQITLVAHHFQRREPFTGIDLRDRFEAMRLGIPVEQARLYNDRLDRGQHMVIVHGTEAELQRAEPILQRRGIQEWRIYDPTEVSTSAPLSGSTHHYAVGFFPQQADAERAIADLRSAGFPLSQVSLVAQRFEQREPFAGVDLLDRFDNSRFGFPDERSRFFHNRVARGDYLLVVHGTPEQLRQAETILNQARIHDFSIYDAPNGVHSRSTQPQATATTPRTHPTTVAPTAAPIDHTATPGERYTASDREPVSGDRPASTEHPNVTIIDRRDETVR